MTNSQKFLNYTKDAKEKMNPLIRSLAIRTMGCIRIQQIVEYLIDPLKDSLKVFLFYFKYFIIIYKRMKTLM